MGPRPSSPEDPSKCIKFSLFFLNVLFWLAAILVLCVGVYMMVEKKDAYQNYLSRLEFDPAVLLVLLGSELFLMLSRCSPREHVYPLLLCDHCRFAFAGRDGFVAHWRLPSVRRCRKV